MGKTRINTKITDKSTPKKKKRETHPLTHVVTNNTLFQIRITNLGMTSWKGFKKKKTHSSSHNSIEIPFRLGIAEGNTKRTLSSHQKIETRRLTLWGGGEVKEVVHLMVPLKRFLGCSRFPFASNN
ncbi:hypothetical protein CEXT_695551 [Caerostris extrusa]|uniref:Uncharacterized protein n=1 Tax=Caerostris extrusa TaxID=172846 RepID=A0AAV4VT39_CAEEX|nr:hypothetical protein CEXT_695551 [Caerostris extrusa]